MPQPSPTPASQVHTLPQHAARCCYAKCPAASCGDAAAGVAQSLLSGAAAPQGAAVPPQAGCALRHSRPMSDLHFFVVLIGKLPRFGVDVGDDAVGPVERALDFVQTPARACARGRGASEQWQWSARAPAFPSACIGAPPLCMPPPHFQLPTNWRPLFHGLPLLEIEGPCSCSPLSSYRARPSGSGRSSVFGSGVGCTAPRAGLCAGLVAGVRARTRVRKQAGTTPATHPTHLAAAP